MRHWTASIFAATASLAAIAATADAATIPITIGDPHGAARRLQRDRRRRTSATSTDIQGPVHGRVPRERLRVYRGSACHRRAAQLKERRVGHDRGNDGHHRLRRGRCLWQRPRRAPMSSVMGSVTYIGGTKWRVAPHQSRDGIGIGRICFPTGATAAQQCDNLPDLYLERR